MTRLNKTGFYLVAALFLLFVAASNEKVTTIFIIGDSTAANKDLSKGKLERGWGMMLQDCFDANCIHVDNHAVNGRSSKSFLDEGRWDKVLEKIKPGDYVIIQFGHNDEKPQPDRHTEPGSTFDDNLARYVSETRERGGIPVLMNSVVRRNFMIKAPENDDDEKLRTSTFKDGVSGNPKTAETEGDSLIDTHGLYREVPRQVARRLNCHFVDANQITHDLEQGLGKEGSKRLHMWFRPGEEPTEPEGKQDNTHYNIYGAQLVARLLADALCQQIPTLKRYRVGSEEQKAKNQEPAKSALFTSLSVDLTKPQPVYTAENGYGYDLVPPPTKQSPREPWFFSIRVPDGNYRVSVVLGGKKQGETTVRAEGRRLMAENIVTKKGEFLTVEFVVNKRSPEIEPGKYVRLKEREKDYLAWDDKLTLEFNGAAPAVRSINIERDDRVPTIYLCGNSTVVDQNAEPWASWGQMITRWFGPEVAISNHAESGLTARTFIAGGRLDKILSTLKKGDLLIAEFGHNDEKEKQPGDGAWYHYQYQLKTFVDKVRGKGADIVFCTPTQRRAFNDDKKTIKNTHGEFPAAMIDVAKREQVPVIDLNAMTKTLFETLGFEDSKRALVHYPAELYGRKLEDNTHFNPYGAYEVAKCVVMGMKQLQLPIVGFLRSDWQDFDPAQPDDWRTFKWAESPIKDIVKPDGN